MADDPVILYQFPPALGLPFSESPPCAKVEAYFRLTDTPYRLELGDTRKSPNKMVPFVRWPDGELQGESGDIIARLEIDSKLEEGLPRDRLERANALAERAEEVVYDACLYARFCEPEGWVHQKPLSDDLIARYIPGLFVPLATQVVKIQQRRRARRGVMSSAAGYAEADRIIEQLEQMLHEEPFLGGPRPGIADCAVWPLFAHTAATLNPSSPRQTIRDSPTLMDWMMRMGQRTSLPLDPAPFQT